MLIGRSLLSVHEVSQTIPFYIDGGGGVKIWEVKLTACSSQSEDWIPQVPVSHFRMIAKGQLHQELRN